MKIIRRLLYALILLTWCSCQSQKDKNIPVIGFVDAFEDETIAHAREGFVQALKDSGYSEQNQKVKFIFRNAQGDIPTLTQIVHYFVSEKVDLIAANSTLASIAAIQNSKEIPVFMMVSAEPDKMMVLDENDNPPRNLFGISETLDYIDTSLALIPQFVHPSGRKLRVGMIFNQAEPQSTNALQRAKDLAEKLNFEIIALPINTSADAQLVTQSLLNKNIDAFFANPDNVVFASFETILKNCNLKNVPVFTSEAGLVKRGAVAAYGADMFQWGYQAGQEAVQFLRQKSTDAIGIEKVKVRKYYYNPSVADVFHFTFSAPFEPTN